MEANDTKWGFLQPWVGALRTRATLDRPKASAAHVIGGLDYWSYPEDDFPVAIDTFALYVSFPADEATRTRDRQLLQKIREALELFTILAAADNPAFVQILAEFLNKAKLVVDDEAGEKPHLVLPDWKCWLDGRLLASDPVARRPSITWADLYGCPEDPETYSLEFRAAKERIVAAGGEIRRELGFVRPSVQWILSHEALGMVGEQKKKSKASTAATEAYVPELQELFKVEVPAIVLMNAFAPSDSAPMNTRTCPFFQLAVSSTFKTKGAIYKLRASDTSFGMITASLARTGMLKLGLVLDDRGVNQRALARVISNRGFLCSTLLYGLPSCKFPGVNLDFPSLPLRCPLRKLELCGYEWTSDTGVGAIYSAIAEARALEKLRVVPECDILVPDEVDREEFEGPMSLAHWCWLAFALWSRASKPSIRELELEVITLTDDDVSAIETVLQCGYPDPVTRSSHASELQLPRYGYVTVPEGAEVVPVDSESTVLVMSTDCRCRALYDPFTMDAHLNAVIPGYGICKVKLLDGSKSFVADPPVSSRVFGKSACTLRDLWLDCVDLESGEAMIRLLFLIGRNLRYLRVRNGEQKGNTVELGALAAACPMLEDLYIHEFDVRVTFQKKALLKWPIKRLVITGSNTEPELALFLRSPASLMSRQLAELKVFCGRACPRDEREDYDFSPGYVDTLKEFDGEYLPVVKEKFPIASKIAMISVVTTWDERAQTLRRRSAARYMDSVLLGMVFAFAAAPERRSVLVNGTKAQMEEDGIKD